tara:strand:- start:6076 stop:7785 length:1710 start_codon:yes stop_codon:yes gene_type:complete
MNYPIVDKPGKYDLLELYDSNIKTYSKLNDEMIKKNESIVRIMTYNIHYWSKINTEKQVEEPNHLKIINNLQIVNPDICCLQEVNFSKTQYITEDFRKAINNIGYELHSYCTTTPSWFKAPYGNAILIKTSLLENLSPSQKNNIYKNNSKGKSTKCFVEINLKNIRIICTHLDVHDKSGVVRIKQISELDNYTSDNKPTIFLGDFNLINEKDSVNKESLDYLEKLKKNRGTNGMAYDFMKKLGWIDAFDINNTYKPPFTTWNLTRIDYIMFKNIELSKLSNFVNKVGVYYSNESDHIPVFIDLNKTDLFSLEEINKLNIKKSIVNYMADDSTLFTLKLKSNVENKEKYLESLTKYCKGTSIFDGKIKYLDDLIGLNFSNAQGPFNQDQWWVKQQDSKIIFNSDSNGHLGDPYMVGLTNNNKNRDILDNPISPQNRIGNSQGHHGIYGKYGKYTSAADNVYSYQWQNVHNFQINSLPTDIKVGIDIEETSIFRWNVTDKRYEYHMILSNGSFKINPIFFTRIENDDSSINYESSHIEYMGVVKTSLDGGYKKKYLKYKNKYLALKNKLKY